MFVTIDGQDKFDRFLYEVDEFHDALLREVALRSRGYVDNTTFGMFGDFAPYDARLIFHTQWAETPCVEVVFEDVAVLNFRPGRTLKPSGHYSEEAVILTLGLPVDGCFVGVRARRAMYTILDRSYLGQTLLAVEDIPFQETDVGVHVGIDVGIDGWIECPHCSNAVTAAMPSRPLKSSGW